MKALRDFAGVTSHFTAPVNTWRFLSSRLKKSFIPALVPASPRGEEGGGCGARSSFSKSAPIPDTVMEEDISSGKFFQGRYFNELLNNDFILEAHSIFIQYHA